MIGKQSGLVFVPNETKDDSTNATDNAAEQENTERRDKTHSVLLLYNRSQLQNDSLVMFLPLYPMLSPIDDNVNEQKWGCAPAIFHLMSSICGTRPEQGAFRCRPTTFCERTRSRHQESAYTRPP
jgi:hypothetical protein